MWDMAKDGIVGMAAGVLPVLDVLARADGAPADPAHQGRGAAPRLRGPLHSDARDARHDDWMEKACDSVVRHGVSAAFVASTVSTPSATFATVRPVSVDASPDVVDPGPFLADVSPNASESKATSAQVWPTRRMSDPILHLLCDVVVHQRRTGRGRFCESQDQH